MMKMIIMMMIIVIIILLNVRFSLEQTTKAQRGLRCSCNVSLNSLLDGVGSQHHAPVDLHPGKTRYSLYKRLGGP
jgi:hypothetical protein